MKPKSINPFLLKQLLAVACAPLALLSLTSHVSAAELFWDANGDTTTATGGAGVWNTASTWRSGSSTGTLGNWADGNNANFGGAATAVAVTLTSSVIVDQIKVTTASYAIGATADTTRTITFGGSYSDTHLAIDFTAAGSNDLSAKVTGTITGGLVLDGGVSNSNLTLTDRFFIRNTANNFIGDVTVLGGKLIANSDTSFGNAANKLILKGGALTANDARTFGRDIQVDADSVISQMNSGVTLTVGKISGASNLTLLSTGTGAITIGGNTSGYTGTFEVASASVVNIGSATSTSGGKWKLSNGTTNVTATNGDAIANGTGANAGNLLMNGGTLNMNGKSETINGLSGATGTIQNQTTSTTSTLTLGDNDSTATFSGTVRNNSGTGGTLAITKIGNGIQTLGGTNSYTGNTTITAGTLLVNGSIGNTAVAVSGSAILGGTGTIGGTVSVGGTASLSAGASIESLSSKALSMSTGTTFIYEAASNSATGADLMAVDGTLSLAGVSLGLDSSTLAALASASFGVNDKITLISYEYNGSTEVTSGFTGYADDTTYMFGSNEWIFNYNDLTAGDNYGTDAIAGGQNRFVTMTAVPEPAAALLGGLGLLALLRRRRN